MGMLRADPAIARPNYLRMTLAEVRRTAFAGRPPSKRAIQKIVESGEWLGETVAGQTFVFVDAAGQPIRRAKSVTTGNADADAVLREWEKSRA